MKLRLHGDNFGSEGKFPCVPQLYLLECISHI